MSRAGDCWDNAMVESFFATLKKELVYRMAFETRRQARTEIFDFIEVYPTASHCGYIDNCFHPYFY